MNIIDTVKDLPITKTFYSLKKAGKPPKIIVQVSKNGEVKVARLKVSEVEYYFHNTNGFKVSHYKGETNADGEIDIYELPFDGWEI